MLFRSGTAIATTDGDVTFSTGTADLSDGAEPLNMTLNFSDTTQYGGTFGVTSITQNGYATGQLSTVAIDSEGIVSAVYTNGRSTQLGQLAMAISRIPRVWNSWVIPAGLRPTPPATSCRAPPTRPASAAFKPAPWKAPTSI